MIRLGRGCGAAFALQSESTHPGGHLVLAAPPPSILRWVGLFVHPCTRPPTASQRRDSDSPLGLRPLPLPVANIREISSYPSPPQSWCESTEPRKRRPSSCPTIALFWTSPRSTHVWPLRIP